MIEQSPKEQKKVFSSLEGRASKKGSGVIVLSANPEALSYEARSGEAPEFTGRPLVPRKDALMKTPDPFVPTTEKLMVP